MEKHIIFGKFREISSLGKVRELECLRCGCEFETGSHPKTLVFCKETKEYFVQCPLCETREAKT